MLYNTVRVHCLYTYMYRYTHCACMYAAYTDVLRVNILRVCASVLHTQLLHMFQLQASSPVVCSHGKSVQDSFLEVTDHRREAPKKQGGLVANALGVTFSFLRSHSFLGEQQGLPYKAVEAKE